MQLDKFTDYGLRILVTLTARADQRISVREVARLFSLSEHHLSKIATELVRGGFVVSERGRHGGLRLAYAPQEINIGAVVRHLKQDDPVVECFGEHSTCLILPACGLRMPMAEAQEAFFATLDRYSLSDVTTRKDQIVRIFEAEGEAIS